MFGRTKGETRWGLLSCLFVLGLITAVIVLPYQFGTHAAGQKGLFSKTESADPGLPNYDIRTEKGNEIADYFEAARSGVGKSAVSVADVREGFVRGEDALRSRVPYVKFEYNESMRIPEVITPDVLRSKVEFLSSPSGEKRSAILRNFLKDNNQLIGIDDQQADALNVTADYTNPDGNLSYARLEQTINGIPVFSGEVNAGFTKDGRMIRVINDLAPGLDYGSLSTDFGDPLDAVKSASGLIKHSLTSADVSRNAKASNDLKVVFGNDDWATTAEKMYFPTEPGVAVPAWRVLIWQPVDAYYVIVDAKTGTMLWRKNISADQTQSATFNVYPNSNSLIDVAESPAPITPGPIDPTLGTQGTQTARSDRTLIGNEGVLSFNNLGWITDGTNGTDGTTDGNAVEAGLDIDGTNGVDPTGKANGTARVFNFAYNPPPGLPAPPDDITTATSRNGAVTQLFYINNRYHDIMYQLGFTEVARNFQNSNFGRGGSEADRVSAEAQDSSGTNNANFATPADGGRGRMQMYRFTQTPNRDGDIDGDVVIHEHTHGLSNRLIGNGSGLTTNRSGSMGEGWSDFYGASLESEPSDPINGIYSTGAYVTYQAFGLGTTNSYYGIRRFPYAVMAFTGGALNRPHNPMTFGNVNTGNCSAFQGAFAPGFVTSSCNEVHNAGEIWATALWEVRAKFVTRLGWAVGNRKILQIVTDGMKLSPLNPTMIQERDSIIAAAAASALTPDASVDVADVREGFRIRGFGFSAADNGTTATEAFDFPNVRATTPVTVSDSTGDNDGFPEPGENVLVSVPVINPSTGGTITNVFANINGGTNVSYGTITDGSTVTQQIPFTVPPATPCGSDLSITINVTSDAGAQSPSTASFKVGTPVGGAPVTFSNNTLINLPSGQPGTTVGPAAPYPSDITVSGLTGNKIIKVKLSGVTHTFPSDLDFLLVGPGGQKYIILSDSGSGGDVTGVDLTLSDGAASQPSTTQWVTGQFRPYNSGANDAFAAPAPAGPYTNAAPGGTDTIASVFGTSGTAMNGTWSLYAVDDASADSGSMTGWSLTFEANDYACSLASIRSRADFDGDGKSDVSVYRPSDGNWYLNRSTAGFGAIHWGGVAGDVLVPGDYDGDGKADFAIWRPSDTANVTDFYILNSNGFTVSGYSHGLTTDVPIPGDFDGDGRSDIVVWRPSTGTWYLWTTTTLTTTAVQFGSTGDIPMAMDNDADGKANLAVYRPSNNTWYIARPTGVPAQNFDAVQWGLAGDVLVPADYDGDNKDDVAVFRPSDGTWYIHRSSDGGTTFTQFGTNGDIPVPGDYDGDGKDDVAVYRPSSGTWYLNSSTAGFSAQAFGVSSDLPIAAAYHP